VLIHGAIGIRSFLDLRHPDDWPTDIDEMYDTELIGLLDRLVPKREYTCRPRSSDPWFDKECLVAKCLTRLERAPDDDDDDFVIYTAELCSLVTAHHLHPHQYADDVQTYGWRPPTESNAL